MYHFVTLIRAFSGCSLSFHLLSFSSSLAVRCFASGVEKYICLKPGVASQCPFPRRPPAVSHIAHLGIFLLKQMWKLSGSAFMYVPEGLGPPILSCCSLLSPGSGPSVLQSVSDGMGPVHPLPSHLQSSPCLRAQHGVCLREVGSTRPGSSAPLPGPSPREPGGRSPGGLA